MKKQANSAKISCFAPENWRSGLVCLDCGHFSDNRLVCSKREWFCDQPSGKRGWNQKSLLVKGNALRTPFYKKGGVVHCKSWWNSFPTWVSERVLIALASWTSSTSSQSWRNFRTSFGHLHHYLQYLLMIIYTFIRLNTTFDLNNFISLTLFKSGRWLFSLFFLPFTTFRFV